MKGFGRALDLSAALGVWDELAAAVKRPSRRAYQTAIDAAVTHPRHATTHQYTLARAHTRTHTHTTSTERSHCRALRLLPASHVAYCSPALHSRAGLLLSLSRLL
jgi:hypothetical protein